MATQDSRIRIKRSTTTGEVPTVAPSTDHTDGTWDALDVYVGELFMNTADDTMYVRTDNGIRQIGIFDPADPCHCVRVKKLTLTSAQVLALNTTPIAFGITVPTGYFIQALGGVAYMNYGTTPYATNGRMIVRTVGATSSQLEWTANSFLYGTVSRFSAGVINVLSAITDTGALINADIEAAVEIGNPTAGDSPITIYVSYIFIQP